jgi:4'-phosphopantetheinyl transferase EntD
MRVRGHERRVADRAAARRAWDIALASVGLSPESAVGSRAHTEGAGAALVGPSGTMLGVDLVSPGRITPRHASAILDPEEWEAIPARAEIRAALGWGLKEAAAKAFGSPVRHFPRGLRIASAPDRLEVICRDQPLWRVVSHWEEIGSLLCVWVIRRS